MALIVSGKRRAAKSPGMCVGGGGDEFSPPPPPPPPLLPNIAAPSNRGVFNIELYKSRAGTTGANTPETALACSREPFLDAHLLLNANLLSAHPTDEV
jgi:hypothetical protein